MLTAETKRHIDAARQVLVGVVPNPTSQIDQITNALIYKFMDDMDSAAIKAGGGPSFFVGDLERYSWVRMMDPKIGNQERMNLYSEALIKFSESKQLPELFRSIFRSAFLPYRSPEVLNLFLKEIDYFDYSHPEELGNAYEYLLSVMGSQGDAGQFRTPRHIIDFMVDVIDPSEDDKILDPACGTGGFLVSSYKHIIEHHERTGRDGKAIKGKPLTPDQRKKLTKNIYGYDIDPGMVRIAQVNMYLHQFKSPQIENYDTLSMDEKWGEKFDVILANPPFMSPKGGVMPHNRFSIKSNRSEVLFVDYIMSHLRPKGRAGIIVPEGIIFQSGAAHQQLRKNLIADGLYAVLSLPSGVFAPYSGVKTSILLFNNELAKYKKEILFDKITNDGTDLGARKRATSLNDLTQAKEVIKQFENGEFKSSSIAHVVDRQAIIDSGDYNLSGDRYKLLPEVRSKFNLIEIGELITEHFDRVGAMSDVEVWSVSNKDGFILSSEYFDKQVASVDISNYKLVKPGYFAYNPSRINVGSLAFNKSKKIGAVSPMYIVFSIKEGVGLSSEYLFNLLKSEELNEFIHQFAQGAVRQQLRFNDLIKIKIPLPQIEVQENILTELGDFMAIISGAEQILLNWKPKIEIDPEWKKVKLEKVCRYSGGMQPPKSTFIDHPKEGYIRLLQIRDYKTDENAVYIPKTEKHKTCKETDIMIGRYGPPVFQILRGKEGAYNVALMKCIPDNSKVTNDWLYYFLLSDPVQEKIISVSGRVRQSGVRPDDLNELYISLPSLKVQERIVEKIKAESVLVESAERLIDIYKEKIKKLFSNLWKMNE